MSNKETGIGLLWNPKLLDLSLSTTSATTKLKPNKFHEKPEHSSLFKPASELVDGLYVRPSDPAKLNKLHRSQVKDTKGSGWFDMPAPTTTPELKKDIQLLKLRSVMDPKRHYKKDGSKSKELPKYFQVGTVIESATDFYSGRLTKKERKTSLADELLSDRTLQAYRKRKVREIEGKNNDQAGNKKWKIRGNSHKRAKERMLESTPTLALAWR